MSETIGMLDPACDTEFVAVYDPALQSTTYRRKVYVVADAAVAVVEHLNAHNDSTHADVRAALERLQAAVGVYLTPTAGLTLGAE